MSANLSGFNPIQEAYFSAAREIETGRVAVVGRGSVLQPLFRNLVLFDFRDFVFKGLIVPEVEVGFLGAEGLGGQKKSTGHLSAATRQR